MSCTADEFTCLDSRAVKCIPKKLVCDGRIHCVDSSDEDINMCNKVRIFFVSTIRMTKSQ